MTIHRHNLFDIEHLLFIESRACELIKTKSIRLKMKQGKPTPGGKRGARPSGDAVKKTTHFKKEKPAGPPRKKFTANQNRKKQKQQPPLNIRAEEKRLDRLREQNERKADKETKQLEKKKEERRKFKILSKKNSKGQPVMKGRMELLLEKIQKRM